MGGALDRINRKINLGWRKRKRTAKRGMYPDKKTAMETAGKQDIQEKKKKGKEPQGKT